MIVSSCCNNYQLNICTSELIDFSMIQGVQKVMPFFLTSRSLKFIKCVCLPVRVRGLSKMGKRKITEVDAPAAATATVKAKVAAKTVPPAKSNKGSAVLNIEHCKQW